MKRKAEDEHEEPVDVKRTKVEGWTWDSTQAHKRLKITQDGTVATGPEYLHPHQTKKIETMAVISTAPFEDGKIHKWRVRIDNEVPPTTRKNWTCIGIGCKDEYLTTNKDYNRVKGKPRHKYLYEVRTFENKPNMVGAELKWKQGDIAECTLDLENNKFTVNVLRDDQTVGSWHNKDTLEKPENGFYAVVRLYPRDQVTLLK